MAKKRAKLSNEQKLQAQVKKLTHEVQVLEGVNKNLTEQVNRAEIRDNDRRNAMQQKDDQLRIWQDKAGVAVAERDRLVRVIDQFTSIQIVSPTSESRALRNTKGSPIL